MQDDADQSGTVMSIFDEDVLEDATSMLKKTAQLQRRSAVSCYQSTQVSRADVPDGTVVIQPDFPLSPLQCAAPAVPVNSDCGIAFTSPAIHSGGRLCTEAEIVAVTAPQCRDATCVVDCTEAHDGLHVISPVSSDVGLPSAVYDRVRDLFCMSEVHQNRLSDTLSNSTASDGRQQNRCVDELVTEAGETVCTIAVSCSGDPTPLDSSYVDTGRMAYLGSDANSLATTSVVSAANAPVVSACVENVESNIGELRIASVYSLQNIVDIAASSEVTQSVLSPCQETYVISNLPCSSAKNSHPGGQNPVTKKKMTSPADNSVHLNPLIGLKRKRLSLREEAEHKSDALFRRTDKMKRGSKKRRLYKHNMLMEDGLMEEQSQNIDTNVHIDIYNDGDAGHMPREMSDEPVRNHILSNCETVLSNDEIPSPTPTLVAAVVSMPTSQTSANPAVASVNDISESCRNLVEVTGVEFDTKEIVVSNKTNVNTHQVTSLQQSIPADECAHVSLEQQIREVQHGTAVTAGTDHRTNTEYDVATVVSTSVLSLPVPNNGLGIASASITGVSVLSPNFVECPRPLNNLCNSEILAGDGISTECANGELLDIAEHTADVAAVDNSQVEVTDAQSTLCETDSRTDSAVVNHRVSVETSSEILSSVAAESKLVRHDDNTQAHGSPHHPANDAVGRSTVETNEQPICVSSLSNTRDPRTDPADNNTDVAYHLLDRSRSQKEIDRHSCSRTANLKSVSSSSAIDLAPCNNDLNELRTITDRDNDWYSQSTKQSLSRNKFRRQTGMTCRARTNSTDHNKNIVDVSRDTSDCHGLTSETNCEEKTSSTTGPCIPSETTNEGSSQSLLCGQKQSGGSYCLPDITESVCRLSAIGTPFPPSNSCSLQCRERCRIAEESLGYCRPSIKADSDWSGGCSGQLMQLERRSTSDLIASFKSNTSSTCSKEQSSGVAPPVSGMSDVPVCTSADAAVVSGTETESKRSSSMPSGGSSKLTLPTPKNSLTCYQLAKSSPPVAAANDSSLVTAASQVQPNYVLIQVLLFYILKLFYRFIESRAFDTLVNLHM